MHQRVCPSHSTRLVRGKLAVRMSDLPYLNFVDIFYGFITAATLGTNKMVNVAVFLLIIRSCMLSTR